MFRSRQSGVAEGCAIFVRLDKFRFIDAHPISLKRDVPVLDRENVGLIVKVKSVEEGRIGAKPGLIELAKKKDFIVN